MKAGKAGITGVDIAVNVMQKTNFTKEAHGASRLREIHQREP